MNKNSNCFDINEIYNSNSKDNKDNIGNDDNNANNEFNPEDNDDNEDPEYNENKDNENSQNNNNNETNIIEEYFKNNISPEIQSIALESNIIPPITIKNTKKDSLQTKLDEIPINKVRFT